jgi:hypothetical protein
MYKFSVIDIHFPGFIPELSLILCYLHKHFSIFANESSSNHLFKFKNWSRFGSLFELVPAIVITDSIDTHCHLVILPLKNGLTSDESITL